MSRQMEKNFFKIKLPAKIFYLLKMTIEGIWPFVHHKLKPTFTNELHLADTIHVDFLGSFYGVLISHGIESGCNLILYCLKKIEGPLCE